MKTQLIKKINEMANTMDLTKFENIGELVNLKLHDLSYYCYQNEIDDDLFYRYCNDVYNFTWLEELKELGLDWVQLGRTSSHHFESSNSGALFNFYDRATYENKSNKEKFFMALDDIFNYEYSYYGGMELVVENEQVTGIDYFDDEAIDTPEALGAMIESLEADVKTLMEDIENIHKGYEWLRLFKENQIENFKEWLENNY